MQTLSLLCPAKLNLFLHITNQRQDGYHNLQTRFVRLNYGDTLNLTLRPDNRIIHLNPISSINPENDLTVRAAKLLQRHTKCQLGCEISMVKRLPMGGGLGGGSSDAASTLLGLNQLWALSLSQSELLTLGQQLGADVPFFILNTPAAWAEGIGDILTPVQPPSQTFLVVCPDEHLSTAELFSHPALIRNHTPIKITDYRFDLVDNAFEPIARAISPQINRLINQLSAIAPTRLTGSGGCLFSCFDNEGDALDAARTLPPQVTHFIAQAS